MTGKYKTTGKDVLHIKENNISRFAIECYVFFVRNISIIESSLIQQLNS